jgi:hypothetical protein
LDQWVDEVNQIGVSLKALAVEPSDRGSLGVRSRLNTLERTLTSSLTVDAASVPYRLRSWQTRLSDIERLLAEGESQLSASPG